MFSGWLRPVKEKCTDELQSGFEGGKWQLCLALESNVEGLKAAGEMVGRIGDGF